MGLQRINARPADQRAGNTECMVTVRVALPQGFEFPGFRPVSQAHVVVLCIGNRTDRAADRLSYFDHARHTADLRRLKRAVGRALHEDKGLGCALLISVICGEGEDIGAAVRAGPVDTLQSAVLIDIVAPELLVLLGHGDVHMVGTFRPGPERDLLKGEGGIPRKIQCDLRHIPLRLRDFKHEAGLIQVTAPCLIVADGLTGQAEPVAAGRKVGCEIELFHVHYSLIVFMAVLHLLPPVRIPGVQLRKIPFVSPLQGVDHQPDRLAPGDRRADQMGRRRAHDAEHLLNGENDLLPNGSPVTLLQIAQLVPVRVRGGGIRRPHQPGALVPAHDLCLKRGKIVIKILPASPAIAFEITAVAVIPDAHCRCAGGRVHGDRDHLIVLRRQRTHTDRRHCVRKAEHRAQTERKGQQKNSKQSFFHSACLLTKSMNTFRFWSYSIRGAYKKGGRSAHLEKEKPFCFPRLPCVNCQPPGSPRPACPQRRHALPPPATGAPPRSVGFSAPSVRSGQESGCAAA